MELEDCAFPLLRGVQVTDQDDEALGDVDFALLVGSMPRKEGMERSDLLSANGGIFKPQGEALSAGAKRDVKVLVVGNPANTNCLIAQQHAKDLDPDLLHRDDATRPQPCDRAARGQGRRAQRRRAPHDDLGQPLGHPVPRRVPRGGRRQARLRGDRPGPEGGSKPSSSPRSSSAARPSSRRGGCRRRRPPPTPRSITSAIGCSARPTATGCRWASSATAATAHPKGSSPASRAPPRTATYQIVQGLEIDDFSRAASTRATRSSSTSETPCELGLI